MGDGGGNFFNKLFGGDKNGENLFTYGMGDIFGGGGSGGGSSASVSDLVGMGLAGFGIGSGNLGLVGSGLGLWGQGQANAANAAQSDKQMAFQAQMSNTAHQREVADLRAAGLNPILSANSGASSPSGAMAVIQNPARDVSSDFASVTNAKSTQNLNREMIKTQRTQQDLNVANSTLTKAKILGEASNSAVTASVNARIMNNPALMDQYASKQSVGGFWPALVGGAKSMGEYFKNTIRDPRIFRFD